MTNFVDYVKICCRTGKGGAGSTHFHRDKLTAKGGPDGGNGGRGGHIILKGNKQLWTLLHLKYRKHVIAAGGGCGGSSHKTGAEGADETLEVPLGTVARNAETNEFLFEISEEGETRTLLAGGRGGMGNSFFKSSTMQTPRFSQPGEEGRSEWMILELKLLADVGLVGFPNAGKSTLLSVISAAKPIIADYAFTTLTPNLGMVEYYNNQSFCIADLPGIIEGASEGKGLGFRFLRHIERNSVLLFLIPADSKNHFYEFQILEKELVQYNSELAQKTKIIAISKSDMLDDELKLDISKEFSNQTQLIFFSSITQDGLQLLKDEIWKELKK